MEPTLAVIGLNFRTSPVAVRERFWISEPRRYEALHQLVRSEGIEEVIVLATCNRTEFILWASDVPTAANSVLRFLTQEYQLRLCEWSHFYRLMDDVALTHIFRVSSSLDSMVLGEPEITGQVKQAWAQAQEAGTTGRFLDAVMQKALTVSKRTRTETAIGSSAVSVPYATVELSRNILGELAGREVLLIGAGKMSDRAAHYLMKAGAKQLKVMNRSLDHAEEMAKKMGATAVSFEDRGKASEDGRHYRQFHGMSALHSQPPGSRRDRPATSTQADGDDRHCRAARYRSRGAGNRRHSSI